MIVVGKRVGEPREEGHEFISILNQRKLQFFQSQTVPDLLSYHSFVYVQKSQQAGGSPMFRGFATYRLVNLLDGIRLNNAIYRAGNLHHLVSLDPFSIVQSEVVYGPSSVLYGSDAIGGAILFYTFTPALDSNNIWRGSVNLLYSSANQSHLKHVHISHHRKKWAFLSSFTFSHYGDLRMGRYGPNQPLRKVYVQRINDSDVVLTNPNPLIQPPSGYDQFNTIQKIVWQPSSSTRFLYAFHYSIPSQYPRYGRLFLLGKDSLPLYATWDYGPQQWLMHHFTIEQRKSTWLFDQLTANLAYQFYEEIRITRRFQSLNQQTQHEKLWSFTSNLDMEKEWSPKLRTYYGIEYVYNSLLSQGTILNIKTGEKAEGPPRYPDGFWSSSGVYLNLLWRPTKPFHIESGIHGSWITWEANFDTLFYPLLVEKETNSYSALTGHISFRYASSSILSVLRLSTAFRAPNFDDIGKVFDSQPGKVVVPNPNLKGEYGYGTDLILRWHKPQSLSVTLVPYFTYLKNALMRLKSQFNGQDSIYYDGILSEVQMVQNGSWIQVYGIQCQFQWWIMLNLSLLSTFNYQKGNQRSETGEIVPPEHIILLFGTIQLKWEDKNWQIAIYLHYNGTMKPSDISPYAKLTPQFYPTNDQGKTYVMGWHTLNLRFQTQISSQFTLKGGVENLTDRRYVPYRSGIAGARRQVILGLDYRFLNF